MVMMIMTRVMMMSGDDYDDNNDNNGGSVNLVRLLVWYVSIFSFSQPRLNMKSTHS